MARGWTQAELAKQLAITNVTDFPMGKRPGRAIRGTLGKISRGNRREIQAEHCLSQAVRTHAVDFMGDGLAVRAMVEGERLAYGHMAIRPSRPRVSKIDPLPHQRIAVYEHMLKQPRFVSCSPTTRAPGRRS